MRNAWSAPSHATFTNPMSVPSLARAVTQPRLCDRIRFHHPCSALPPCDCVSVKSSWSVASPRHANRRSTNARPSRTTAGSLWLQARSSLPEAGSSVIELRHRRDLAEVLALDPLPLLREVGEARVV